MTGELNKEQINNILSSQAIGRLACTDGMQPYIIPVTYAFDGNYIYGQTNTGLKLKMLRKNPNVCFEVEIMTDMQNWQCIIVYGHFEELKNKEAENAREILFGRVYTLQTSSTVHAHEHGVSAKIDDSKRVKMTLYRIKIIKVTGRYEKQ
jgi:uncharacterized protein